MSTFIKNFMKYRFLLIELVKKGIKLKYRRSYLGILWTLLEPLLTTIVLTVIFGGLFNKGGASFPIYILAGRLLYSFFSTGTSSAMKSIRSNAGMIKKVYVPKYMYPLSTVIYNYIIFLISLIILVAVSLFLGVMPTWRIFLAIVPLTIVLIMTIGTSMILATMAVFFRDLEYLWHVFTMLIMYGCAIFYYAEDVAQGSKLREMMFSLNPLYCCIANFRSAVLAQPFNWEYALYSAVFSVVCFVLGVVLFFKKQDKFILYI